MSGKFNPHQATALFWGWENKKNYQAPDMELFFTGSLSVIKMDNKFLILLGFDLKQLI